MNVAVLSGRLANEPKISYGKSGIACAAFTIATEYSKDETSFIAVKTFDKNAEFVEKYLHKGNRIELSGRIHTGSYENQNGKTVYFTEVTAGALRFGESKAEAEGRNTESNHTAADVNGFSSIPDGIDEDLPFK